MLFSLLYKYDNKYTHNSIQPIGGIWDLSSEDFSNSSLYFPIYDWEFYPDVLLTPQDFKNGRPDVRMEYITLGERTSITRESAFGKGTYRLNIILPDTKQSYMMYLPEIFNSYRLYVNEDLLLNVGNIQKGEIEIQNRAITFTAERYVQIILAVNSTSHFYSGIIYPPIFGTPFNVNTTRGLHILLVIIITVIGFICFLLSVWLGFRTKQIYAKLFGVLCAVATGYTCHSIIHTFIPVSSMIIYTIEIGAYYAIFIIIILIHNMLCNLPRAWKAANITVSSLVCIMAIAFSHFSSRINIEERAIFSDILDIYKWTLVLTLSAAVIYAMYNRIQLSKPLLYGAIVFAVSLIFDRVYRLYEPIYTGWFGEISIFVYIMILGYIVWANITDAYRFNLIFTEQKRQMERQIIMQKEHYNMINDKIEETRRLRHDMRQHFRVMMGLIHKKNYDELTDYIKNIESSDYELPPVILCSNSLIDALLQYYGSLCIKKEIDFDVQFSASKTLPISDNDLTILLGNLLENAYEACVSIEDNKTERSIYINGVCNEKILKLKITNTSVAPPDKRGTDFYSTKHEGIGIGLRSVRSVVEKHKGILDISYENNRFSVSILISFS